jgi:prepilin-type N-terminal cleavage/methylation domain-containing protein
VLKNRIDIIAAIRMKLSCHPKRRSGCRAFTLIEVVIASGIMGLVFAGIINCYIQSGLRVQWTGYSLAAQALASQTLEQVRSASWDPAQAVPVNNMTNLNLAGASYNSGTKTYTGYSVSILDVPYSTTNFTLATNFVTVQLVSSIGGQAQVQMQFIRVDTVWPFGLRRNAMFTNTVSTMIAPDDRQL